MEIKFYILIKIYKQVFKIEKREDKKFFEELNIAYENILNYLIDENNNYCGYDLADFIRDHMYDMIVREIDINPNNPFAFFKLFQPKKMELTLIGEIFNDAIDLGENSLNSLREKYLKKVKEKKNQVQKYYDFYIWREKKGKS